MDLQKKLKKIIVLSGKARSGKNKVAEILNDYYGTEKSITLAYAYYIKDYLRRMDKYNENEKEKYRSLLQDFGVEFLNKKIEKDFLINRLIEDIEVFSYFYDIVIVTDARLKKEIQTLIDKYDKVITIRINSKEDNNLGEYKKHITEVDLDDYSFDYKIDNNYNIDDLRKQVFEILKEEENE